VEAIASHLQQPVPTDWTEPNEWKNRCQARRSMAETLRNGSTAEQRERLLRLKTDVRLNEDSVKVAVTAPGDKGPTNISVPTALVRKGHELKIAVHPDNRSPATLPDPVLVKLIGQAFAAREHFVEGREKTILSDYSRPHLQRLARLSWLAPDIVSDILEGRQPPHLTARYLLRCGDVPLDWSGQREFLGFS
jgi:hypothetical protein